MQPRQQFLRGPLLLLAICLALPGAVRAQQYFDPGILQKSIQQKPEEYQAVGARLGGFNFWPGAELAYENNDNIFYDDQTKLSDDIWHLRPWFNLASDWSNHSLNFSGWADLARYNDNGELDYDDWATRLDGRIHVRHNSWFSWEGSYMHLHEDRRTPDSRQGLYPTEFDYYGGGLGYDHVFNRLKLGGYLRTNTFDYDNNVDLNGNPIDNQFRNRDESTLTLRADYLARPGRSYFASYGRTTVDYDLMLDQNGLARSSSGDVFNAGVKWDLTGVLTGDLFGAWSNRDYDDPTLPSVSGFHVGGDLSWSPSRLTLVNIRMAGGPQETVQPGTSGYYSRLYSARLQHELRRNVLLNLRGSYTSNQYETVPGAVTPLHDTEVYRAGLGLSYLMNRNFYLSAGFVYERQDANQPAFEYRTNRYFLTLGLEL